MKTFYGNFERKIDDKGRIIMPAEFDLVPCDKIVFLDNDIKHDIYYLEELNEIVRALRDLEKCNINKKQKEEVLRKLEFIFDHSSAPASLDNQRRVLLPFETGDSNYVKFQGQYDHIRMQKVRK